MNNHVFESVLKLNVNEKPREKLLLKGAESLSDAELLAILIGSGYKDRNVEAIALDLVKVFDMYGFPPPVAVVSAVRGMGTAKTSLIFAGTEFCRRRFMPDQKRISSPGDMYPFIRHYADREQETFLSISLNGAYEIKEIHVVSIGILNRSLVHPREVFSRAISCNAAALVVAHNHPSGSVEPSSEDREVTRRLKDAGEILGISLLDHLVFSPQGYFSFMEEGQL